MTFFVHFLLAAIDLVRETWPTIPDSFLRIFSCPPHPCSISTNFWRPSQGNIRPGSTLRRLVEQSWENLWPTLDRAEAERRAVESNGNEPLDPSALDLLVRETFGETLLKRANIIYWPGKDRYPNTIKEIPIAELDGIKISALNCLDQEGHRSTVSQDQITSVAARLGPAKIQIACDAVTEAQAELDALEKCIQEKYTFNDPATDPIFADQSIRELSYRELRLAFQKCIQVADLLLPAATTVAGMTPGIGLSAWGRGKVLGLINPAVRASGIQTIIDVAWSFTRTRDPTDRIGPLGSRLMQELSQPTMMRSRIGYGLTLAMAVVALTGCYRAKLPATQNKPPDVIVAIPVMVDDIIDYEEFTGRTEAYRYLEIRSRVSGELMKVNFKDGEHVQKGKVLFEIDDRPYIAARENAKGMLAQAKAQQVKADVLVKRAAEALKSTAISPEEYDTRVADQLAAIGMVEAAKAALQTAELNVEWTRITAPYSGRMSRRLVDPGTIVTSTGGTANGTLMTTLVVLNPIYVGFDIDERSVANRREAIHDGSIRSMRDVSLDVNVGMSHQEGYPFKARLTFSDNQLDTGTGTLHVRGEMQNPSLQLAVSSVVGAAAGYEIESQARLLSPGMFVRVQLPAGAPRPRVMIPEEAIGSDQGQRFVFVVNDKDEVEYRRVVLGPQKGKLRAVNEKAKKDNIYEGVDLKERVIVSGQQRTRAGSKVNPKLAPTATDSNPGKPKA